MSRKIYRIVLPLIILLGILSTFASATGIPRASDQIDNYRIDVIPNGSGALAIEFSVTGTDIMSKIGAKKITVYERTGTTWAIVESLNQYDTNMSSGNVSKYGNTIYFYGQAGTEYKVSVTIFAQDGSGVEDSRVKEFGSIIA